MIDIVFVLLIISFALLMAYYLGVWIMFYKSKKMVIKPFDSGVSIVVVVRHDIQNLNSLICSLIEQNCEKFEIILVADRSTMGTVGYLRSLQTEHPEKIKVVEIDRDTPYPWPGRKFALTLGIRAASYEHIVSLGSEAKIADKNWLRALISPFSDSRVKIVISRSERIRHKGFFATLVYYIGYGAGVSKFFFGWMGIPYAGDADNFAFEKEMFLSGSGYMNYMKVFGAEADFLIQSNAKRGNTVVNLSASAKVCAEQKGSILKKMSENRGAFSYYKPKARLLFLLLPAIKITIAVSAAIMILR